LTKENQIRDLFEQNSPEHLPFRPQMYFDWLFVMQHYGAPTRLLDWTENPLVGLFFACIDRKEPIAVLVDGQPAIKMAELDGAVWALDPLKLNASNKLFAQETAFVPFARQGLPNEDKGGTAKLGHYDLQGLIERTRRPEIAAVGPLAVIGPRNTARMRAQQGAFTVFDEDGTALDARGPTDGSHIFKFEIPHAVKPQIRRELDAIGINDMVLFPSLEQVGRHSARIARGTTPGGE
jgi:hypothetical protein